MYESIVKGENVLDRSTREFQRPGQSQALALDVELIEDTEVLR